jgi:hypothetical protein
VERAEHLVHKVVVAAAVHDDDLGFGERELILAAGLVLVSMIDVTATSSPPTARAISPQTSVEATTEMRPVLRGSEAPSAGEDEHPLRTAATVTAASRGAMKAERFMERGNLSKSRSRELRRLAQTERSVTRLTRTAY